ncbi:conjugative transposon protein TraM [Flavobacterium sp. fv08]|uniref:conjugative transposon protein TraM n=1 Tax=Flavobacterium sp. fv08 TaxID=1761784 RepID=UPI0008AB9495|nr:conjugative transposon protein TraM [Flavobacterium sp. fv08]SEP07035.1 Bacteroides conjugative transposon TraM protein [Flavobacterium sp. fv08]
METTKRQRQKKLLWILPILAVPLLTVLFWAMGGGTSGITEKPLTEKGLNRSLPETAVPESGLSKLNYYEIADEDSTRQENLKSKDPYFTDTDIESDFESEMGERFMKSSFKNPNEEKVMEKLKALQQAVSQSKHVPESRNAIKETPASYGISGDIERLEAVAASMNATPEEDHEMQQINGMLENILDIQHPQRVQDRMRKEQRMKQGTPSPIGKPSEDNIISQLSADSLHSAEHSADINAFFSLESVRTTIQEKNAISATIAESQVCVNGSTVKFRLSQEIELNGVRIPKNTFVYGIASLKGERLTVEINSIRFENSVFPVELLLYDMDGLEGIYIPGAISRDVAKASAERSIQPLGITSLDDSWGSQAAGAGIEAAKSLLTKKVKLVKVMVKSGYQVLLKDKRNNN